MHTSGMSNQEANRSDYHQDEQSSPRRDMDEADESSIRTPPPNYAYSTVYNERTIQSNAASRDVSGSSSMWQQGSGHQNNNNVEPSNIRVYARQNSKEKTSHVLFISRYAHILLLRQL